MWCRVLLGQKLRRHTNMHQHQDMLQHASGPSRTDWTTW